MSSLHLDNTALTPHVAWSALATVAGVLGVAIVAGVIAGPNTGVLFGVGAAVVAIVPWCVAFLLRRGTETGSAADLIEKPGFPWNMMKNSRRPIMKTAG